MRLATSVVINKVRRFLLLLIQSYEKNIENCNCGLAHCAVHGRKPGALRNGAPFKDWVLPAAMERVRRKLASADDGNRQMVDILTAVLTDGLPAVEAACAEAIAHGVHSADVVLNILARQRDPGPPATILTPAALTLRHAPIADCARYDNLRRTI